MKIEGLLTATGSHESAVGTRQWIFFFSLGRWLLLRSFWKEVKILIGVENHWHQEPWETIFPCAYSGLSSSCWWPISWWVLSHWKTGALKWAPWEQSREASAPNNLYNLPTVTYTSHPIILTVCLWAAPKEALSNPFVAVKYGGQTSKTWYLGRQEEHEFKVILSYVGSWRLTWVLREAQS